MRDVIIVSLLISIVGSLIAGLLKIPLANLWKRSKDRRYAKAAKLWREYAPWAEQAKDHVALMLADIPTVVVDAVSGLLFLLLGMSSTIIGLAGLIIFGFDWFAVIAPIWGIVMIVWGFLNLYKAALVSIKFAVVEQMIQQSSARTGSPRENDNG